MRSRVFVFVFGVFVFVFGVFYQNHFGFPSSSPFSPRWGVVLLGGGTGYANHLSYLFPETLPLLYSREDFWPPKVLNMQNIGYANHPLFPETLPLAQLHMNRVFGPIKVLNMERLGESANHPSSPLFPETLPLLMLSLLYGRVLCTGFFLAP